MTKNYKILHIPSGQYVYNDNARNVAIFTKQEAEHWIDIVTHQPNPIHWFESNKAIGNNLIESEFEFIEVPNV